MESDRMLLVALAALEAACSNSVSHTTAEVFKSLGTFLLARRIAVVANSIAFGHLLMALTASRDAKVDPRLDDACTRLCTVSDDDLPELLPSTPRLSSAPVGLQEHCDRPARRRHRPRRRVGGLARGAVATLETLVSLHAVSPPSVSQQSEKESLSTSDASNSNNNHRAAVSHYPGCCESCAASRSPIHHAAEAGHPRCIEALPDALVNALADWPNVPGRGVALHVAAVNLQHDCIRVLARKEGVDINARTTRQSMTPMSFCAMKGDRQGLELIAAFGANPRHGAVLHLAALSGSVECVDFLIGLGAPLDSVWNGCTPIVAAAARGHDRVVSLLAERGASMASSKGSRLPPIVAAIVSGNASTVETLLTLGVDANTLAPSKQPLLHEAARISVPGLTAALLRHGADMNTKVAMATLRFVP